MKRVSAWAGFLKFQHSVKMPTVGLLMIAFYDIAGITSPPAIGATTPCADRPTIDLSAGPVGQERQLDTNPKTANAWQWSLLRQPHGSRAALSAVNARDPKFTPDLPGTYVFQLHVTNSAGAFAARTLTFPAVSPVAILESARGETTGSFHFAVAGEAGQVVVVETSTNLTQWSRTETNAIGTDPARFTDAAAHESEVKFYRACAQFYRPFANYVALGAPEGVAVDHLGNIYLSFGDQVTKVDLAGKRSVFARFSGAGSVGMAVDTQGNLYVARGEGPGRGVDRIGPDGRATHVPGTEKMAMANALTRDSDGNLYATESFSYEPPLVFYPGVSGRFGRGAIWRVPKDGEAELWVRDDLLTGTGEWKVSARPWGANGIGYFKGSIYVANTERGLVLRVPVLSGGGPGTIETFAQVPDPDPRYAAQYGLAGPDGLALDSEGNVYVPVANRFAVVRFRPSHESEVIASMTDNLSVPMSVCFGTTLGERTSLFVTNGDAPLSGFPAAGLVKIETGITGLPLR